jgi:DNA-binding SARP family transcriptional activator
MTHLDIALLGSFTVTVDGQPATDFDSNKVRALLAYLAVESDRPHRRETLAGMLWPEATNRSAFNNLRYSLSDLRQTIGDRQARPSFLLISHDTLQFNRESDHALDVVSLGRCLNADQDNPAAMQELAEAVGLYRGWFLEGFSVSGSAPFEEWTVFKREQIGRLALRAFNRLAAYREDLRDYEQACSYANRQIELEPWQEEAHRQLMRSLALSGRRSAALHQYEVCRRTLQQELNVEPATETTDLYNAIRAQAVHVAARTRPNPYRRLTAFTEADAGGFFGRDGDKARLLEAVRSRAVVMLVGASACGKSSLVNAGLLPQLRHEGGWAVAAFRAGGAPFRDPAGALAPMLTLTETAGAGAVSLDRLSGELANARLSLGQAADQIFALNPRTRRLLVVVDQLEELLESSSVSSEGREFLNWLSAAIVAGSSGGRNPRPPVVLLLVLREDCLAHLDAWPALEIASRGAALRLAPMSRADMEQAAARPAERLGVRLEPGLALRLAGDASEQPGGLALLQLTLTELWQCQETGLLTHAAYGAIGRMAGVAVRHADRTFGELDTAGQAQARRLLVQMVRPGVDAPDVRRSAALYDVPEDALPVLGRLREARLVVASRGPGGQASLDLSHDGLVWQWGQLKTWVDADRQFCVWLEGMRAALRQWQAGGSSEDLLLRGAALEQANAWLRARGSDACVAVRRFVASSESAQARQRADREAFCQKEAQRSRALVVAEAARAQDRASERIRSGRLRLAAAVLAVWSLLVTGALLVHWLAGK